MTDQPQEPREPQEPPREQDAASTGSTAPPTEPTEPTGSAEDAEDAGAFAAPGTPPPPPPPPPPGQAGQAAGQAGYQQGWQQQPPPGYAQPAPAPGYGQPAYPAGYVDPQAKSKIAAGLLGIFLGGFGVHRFYLGYTRIGVIQIVVTVLTCGIGSLWGFVEGILYLVGANGYTTDAQGRPLRD